MDRRLVLLAMAAWAIFVAIGCGDGTPNDPKMTPEESAKLRENAYTDDQAKARAQRPR